MPKLEKRNRKICKICPMLTLTGNRLASIDVVLVSLLLSLDRFRNLFWCFCWCIWTGKFQSSYFLKIFLLWRSAFKFKWISFITSIPLTHFKSMFHFYTLWKHQETKGILMFPGGTGIEHWLEMDYGNNRLLYCLNYFKKVKVTA